MFAFRFKNKIKNIEHLVYLDQINNSLAYHGVSISDNNIMPLNKIVLDEIYDFIRINDNCAFVKNNGIYDIYYDYNSDLYHYIKDNKEDLLMFLLANSKSAVLHNNKLKSNKNKKDTFIQIARKGFTLIGNIILIFSVITAKFDNEKINNSVSGLNISYSSINKKIYNITVESFIKMIYSSNRLNNGEKEFLSNYQLLSDVIPYYTNTIMEYIIDDRFNNFGIVYDEFYNGEAGVYYGINEMCLANNFKELGIQDNYKKSVVGHEFIHALQADCYIYLVEASAEVISSEYFNRDAYSYQEACFNFKLLIETLGPEVMWNYIFSGDDSEFDKLLRDNLSESDYNVLINQLKLSPFDGNPDHELITNLIHKLYKNMYNQDIMDDHDIYVFDGTYIDKTYFKNQSHGMDIIITCETAKAIDLDIVELADLYEYKKEIDKEEFYKYLNQWHSIHYYKDNNSDSYDLILIKDGVDVSSYYDKESNKIVARENTDFKEYDFSKECVDELARDYKILYCVRTVNKDFDCKDMEGRKIASILISKNSDYICQGADIIYHVKSMEERFPNQSVNKEIDSGINVSDNSFTK